MRLNHARHFLREPDAIHGERMPSRHLAFAAAPSNSEPSRRSSSFSSHDADGL